MDFRKHLSSNDSFSLLEIIDDCVYCQDLSQFKAIIKRLKRLVSFRGLTMSHINFQELRQEEPGSINNLDLGFPEEFMRRYLSRELYWDDVPVMAFMRSFELQNWQEAIEVHNTGVPGAVDAELNDHGLVDGWVYGTRDITGFKITTISLGSETIENSHRTKAIIKLSTPHLAEAYKRILQIKEMQKYRLTRREFEVLNWLKEGKTSWEISVILNLSERCVNFHINNAKNKLNAVNRTQAVAVALGAGHIVL